MYGIRETKTGLWVSEAIAGNHPIYLEMVESPEEAKLFEDKASAYTYMFFLKIPGNLYEAVVANEEKQEERAK